MHEFPDLSQLTSGQRDELIRQLFPLVAQVRWLSARVAELEARLSQGSHHSSKPPSSDGLMKKTPSLRQPSGRRAGGQAGHPGRTLERTALPDQILHTACRIALRAVHPCQSPTPASPCGGRYLTYRWSLPRG